ncbi:MAG: hypothetical protein R3F59_05085 [Myxococcota bacterium]
MALSARAYTGHWRRALNLSFVQLRLPDGEVVQLAPGSLIGRLSSAELRFTDPNVSEAHALVSLRGRELKLLALRRWFEVAGKRLSELVLAPGQQIHLAPEVVLTVEAVEVAPTVLALTGLGEEPVELEAAVHAVVRSEDGALRLDTGYVPDALARVELHRRLSPAHGDGRLVDLVAGTSVDVDGVTLQAVEVDVGAPQSTLHAPPTTPPLRIVARHDTVHLPHRQAVGRADGDLARIISEARGLRRAGAVVDGRPRDLGRGRQRAAAAAELGPQHALAAGAPAVGGDPRRPRPPRRPREHRAVPAARGRDRRRGPGSLPEMAPRALSKCARSSRPRPPPRPPPRRASPAWRAASTTAGGGGSGEHRRGAAHDHEELLAEPSVASFRIEQRLDRTRSLADLNSSCCGSRSGRSGFAPASPQASQRRSHTSGR